MSYEDQIMAAVRRDTMLDCPGTEAAGCLLEAYVPGKLCIKCGGDGHYRCNTCPSCEGHGVVPLKTHSLCPYCSALADKEEML